MRRYSTAPSWIGAFLALVLLSGCTAPAATTVTTPPLAPGSARVWFLRQSDPTAGNIYAAAPLIYIDRKPFTQIQQGTAFFHDFAPGRYRLSAQAFGTYSDQHDILHLDPGKRGLCSDHSGRQLGTGLAGRRLQLCCIADGPRPRPPVPADFDRPRPALKR